MPDGPSSQPLSPIETPSAAPRPSFFTRLRAQLVSALGARSDLDAAIDEATKETSAAMPRAKREMIERVIAFDEKRVSDVMAPRADIVAVDIDTPLDALIKAFCEAGHSRLPVYRNDLDDPVGMVHIKDVVALIANDDEPAAIVPGAAEALEKQAPLSARNGDETVLNELKRDLLYVPPSMGVTDLLLRMQASRIHMALVIDEFGGTDGLLTIEDLVEEIVGEINDEHDEEDSPHLVSRGDGEWEADARVEVEEFMTTTGVPIDCDEDEEEADTLGGLVFTIAGRVPQRGEVLRHSCGLEFEVVDADPRKIRKILIRRRTATVVPEAAE